MIILKSYSKKEDQEREEQRVKNEQEEREKEADLYKRGIVGGTALTALGGTALGLRKAIKRIDKNKLAANPGATTYKPESLANLKSVGKGTLAVAVPLTAYAAYKYHKLKKGKKNDNKA